MLVLTNTNNVRYITLPHMFTFFFFQAEDGIRDLTVTGVQTCALPISVKAGRFFSGIGYLNPQHAHTWDFVDNPLAYQAMLGTQFGDDGVQLTWLAPTEIGRASCRERV